MTLSSPTLPHTAASPQPGTAPRGRRVTDAPTRMFHWLFALCFAGAYASGDSDGWRALHVTLGYTLAGLLGFRLLYGLVGPRQARLGALARRLSAASAALSPLAQGPDRLGAAMALARPLQNAAMALVIIGLLAVTLPLTLSGLATYQEWGGEWLEDVHEAFGNAMLVLVLAHIGLIVLLSVARRRNQAWPMLTGRVEGPGPDLVRRNHAALAALLLLAVLAFGAWQWRQHPHGLLADPTAAERERHHGDHDDDDDD